MKHDDSDGGQALGADEARCLAAIRQGASRLTAVAALAGCDLSETSRAIAGLVARGLVDRDTWSGGRAKPTIGRRRRHQPRPLPSPGSTAARLLALLEAPMSGKDLHQELGVTRQRVTQIVLRLNAQGLLRVADPDDVLHCLLPAASTVPALSRKEARLLSALPRSGITTLVGLGAATGFDMATRRTVLDRLVALGLAEERTGLCSAIEVRITELGAAHPQCGGGETAPPPQPVRSDRRMAVLGLVAAEAPVRGTDIARRFDLPGTIANALVQYFKRKGFIEKVGAGKTAGYRLTPRGAEFWAARQAAGGEVDDA